MDQAVFALSTKAGGSFIFAVSAGYIFRYKLDGTIDTYARYAYGWGNASIAYDPINDFIFCSFWNELRADDAGTVEGATLVRGLYRIDPGTLAVNGFLQMSTDPPPLLDTGPFTGPRQIVYYNGFIWLQGLERAGFGGTSGILRKINPLTMTVAASASGYASGASQFTDIAIDTFNGLLWESSGENQRLASTDLATFSVQNNYDLNAIVVAPGAGVVSQITVDLANNTQQFFPGGPFANGYYLIEYVSGVLAGNDGWQNRYFVMDPHGILTCPDFTPGFIIYQDASSVWPVNGSQFVQDTPELAHNEGLVHNTSMDHYVPGGGGVWNIGMTVPQSPTIVPNDQPNNCPNFWLIENYVFNLRQVLTYPAAATLKFTPYGICFVPGVNCIYCATRSSTVLCVVLGTGNVIQVLSGDADSFAYRARYNPKDGYVYVPGYKSNQIKVINPSTNAVVATYSNIASCFDVCFSPSGGKWAVCHAPKGIVPF